MRVSTEISSAAKIVGEEKAIEYIAKAGFDAWDFSMFDMCKYDWDRKILLENNHPLSGNDYAKFAKRLRQIGLDNGIECNQSHAPFPSDAPQIQPYLKRAIECTAIAGGKICVIHPGNNKSVEENAEMYFELLPFAKECGVKIATENMWSWVPELNRNVVAACGTPQDFCKHLKAVDDEFFVACLDIGHAEMECSGTSAVEMVRALGSKCQALHIQDNDKLHDSHQPPFSMSIDFNEVIRALKEINYNGYFTAEAVYYLEKFNEENIFYGIKDLYNSVRRLADMYEYDIKD